MELSKRMGPDHGNGWLYCPSPSPHDFPRVAQASSEHMCHPWPIGRVGSRVQNFALKSQIFFAKQISADFADFFVATCWKNLAKNFEILCP